MRNMTVAVTGATGFVGARVVRRLAETDYEIRAGYRPGSPRWHVEDIDCQWVPLELNRPATARRLVDGAVGVVHCGDHRLSGVRRWRRARRIGVGRLRCLLDACVDQGVRRVVYVSDAVTMGSRKSRGPDGADQLDETSRYVPGSTTDGVVEARAAMEAEIYRYVARGLDAVVALPTVVMGPGDVEMRTGRWVRAITEGWLPAIPEGQTVNVVDVRDVADGIVAALKRGRTGRRYALGGANVELGRLVEEIARYGQGNLPDRRIDVGRARRVAGFVERIVDGLGLEGPERLADVAGLGRLSGPVSSERAEGELNFRARSMETTIRETVEWMRRVGYLSWSSCDSGVGRLR